MQPCSHPWYGLIDCENGTSGDSLCAMMVRARWMVTTVRGGGGASSADSLTDCQPSSHGYRASARKRLPGLNVAPPPFIPHEYTLQGRGCKAPGALSDRRRVARAVRCRAHRRIDMSGQEMRYDE